jgi:hypothetical protein
MQIIINVSGEEEFQKQFLALNSIHRIFSILFNKFDKLEKNDNKENQNFAEDPFDLSLLKYSIKAEEVEKIGEDKYRVKDGFVTACEDTIPKWSFSVRDAVFRIDRRVNLRHTVFRIKKIPLVTYRLARFQRLINVGQDVMAVGGKRDVTRENVFLDRGRRRWDRLHGDIAPGARFTKGCQTSFIHQPANPPLGRPACNVRMEDEQLAHRQTAGGSLETFQEIGNSGHGVVGTIG